MAAATRSTRALTISSAASTSNNEDGVTGGGAPYNHQQQQRSSSSGFDPSNPFAPLGDMSQSGGRATRVRHDESSSADTTADGEEGQRGAPL